MSCCHGEIRGEGMLTVDEARKRLLSLLTRLSARESVPVVEAVGRVLAEDQLAPYDVPPSAVSLLDGYAIRCADLAVRGETRLEVAQTIFAGQVGRPLAAGEAARIFTGAPLPEGADAIVAQEVASKDEAGWVTFSVRPAPGEEVRPRGADVRAGQKVLTAGTRLHPGHVAQLGSLGQARVAVVRRPRVAVFTTGDELVAPGESLRPGQIFNANHGFLVTALKALVLTCWTLGR